MGFLVGLTFGKSWTVNGAPTDATSATIGIYDDTAGLQAVPAGTAMDHPSTGQYSYQFAAALPEHSYTATIAIAYDGQTYTFNVTTEARPPSPPREGCHSIEEALRENAAGARQVTSAAGSMQAHPIPDQILAADREAVIRARRKGQIGAPLFRIAGEGTR